jgi:hypothetical protein
VSQFEGQVVDVPVIAAVVSVICASHSQSPQIEKMAFSASEPVSVIPILDNPVMREISLCAIEM